MFQKRKSDLSLFCPAISEKVLPMAVATPQASYFLESSTVGLLDSFDTSDSWKQKSYKDYREVRSVTIRS